MPEPRPHDPYAPLPRVDDAEVEPVSAEVTVEPASVTVEPEKKTTAPRKVTAAKKTTSPKVAARKTATKKT